MTTIRLMLVDDHPLVRDGLRVRLEAVPGLAIVAEADSADAAVQVAATHTPDLVLMDIGLRGTSGIDATRALRAQQPQLRVLMLSMHDGAEVVRDALAAGAGGYVLKDSPAEEIVQAIHAVMAGQQHLSPGLVAAPPSSRPPKHEALTPREREVLALIAEGLSSREIGERLQMGVRTVETHRTALRRKLELGSAAALVRYAVERRRG
jgi:two-component system, NarL family, nitrate/nitrite response regulator NarL